MVMNSPLLSQFQGAFLGAAIADLMSVDLLPVPGMPKRVAEGASEGVDQPLAASTTETALGDRSFYPGQMMVTITSNLISDERDTGDSQHQATPAPLGWSTSDGIVPLSRAIALVPMVLYLHDDNMNANIYSQRLIAFATSQGQVLFPPLSEAELGIGLTLALIFNGQFHPATHIPTLLSLMQDRMEDGGTEQPLYRVLGHVHEAVVNGHGASSLNQALSKEGGATIVSHAALTGTMGMSHPQQRYGNADIDVEAIALGLILYCFLSTPKDYSLAMIRLRRLLQRWSFPPSFHPIACILMGILLGSYRGVWQLPAQYYHPLRAFGNGGYAADALNHRWNANEQGLLSLGFLLWALWSGVDKMRVESLRRGDSDGLEFVTAPIHMIRMFGH